MTKHVSNSSATKKLSLIVFGLDGDDKPRAGVFAAKVGDAVRQAASQLRLRTFDATSVDGQALAARTPAGRVQDDGKPFLPYVPRDLYDRLATIADAAEVLSAPVPPPDNGSGAPPTAPGLPTTWDAIAVGHLVIAQDDYAGDGWWEATVINRSNDILTLRWRDYPRFKPFTRHVAAVALLNPSHK
jgi:hypothetical protein